MDISLIVIGAGSMGGALTRALIEQERVRPDQVVVCDHHPERLSDLTERGVKLVASHAELSAGSLHVTQEGALARRIVLLAVKPQYLQTVLAELDPAVYDGALVISVAAGIARQTLISWMSKQVEKQPDLVRAMPNLGALVGDGVTALCAPDISQEDKTLVETLFSSVGYTIFTSEEKLDVIGAIAGSTPAYFALAIDALTLAGVSSGLDAATSRQCALRTMRSSADLMLAQEVHPRQLMERVQSPAGTTVAGTLAAGHLIEEGFFEAVSAALDRTRELSSASEEA